MECGAATIVPLPLRRLIYLQLMIISSFLDPRLPITNSETFAESPQEQ